MIFTLIIISLVTASIVAFSIFRNQTIDTYQLMFILSKISTSSFLQFCQLRLIKPSLSIINKFLKLMEIYYTQIYPILVGFVVAQFQYPLVIVWLVLGVIVYLFYYVYPKLPHLGIFMHRISKSTKDNAIDYNIKNLLQENQKNDEKYQQYIQSSKLTAQDQKQLINLKSNCLGGFDYDLLNNFYEISDNYSKYSKLQNQGIAYKISNSIDGSNKSVTKVTIPRMNDAYKNLISKKMYELYNHSLDFNASNTVSYLPQDLDLYFYFIFTLNIDQSQKQKIKQNLDEYNSKYKSQFLQETQQLVQQFIDQGDFFKIEDIFKNLQLNNDILQKINMLTQPDKQFDSQEISKYLSQIDKSQFWLEQIDITNYQYVMLQNIKTQRQSKLLKKDVKKNNLVLSINQDWLSNVLQEKDMINCETLLWKIITYCCINYKASKQNIRVLKKLLYCSFITLDNQETQLVCQQVNNLRKVDYYLENMMNYYIPQSMIQKYLQMLNNVYVLLSLDSIGQDMIQIICKNYTNINQIVNIDILEQKGLILQYYDSEFYDSSQQKQILVNSIQDKYKKFTQNAKVRLTFKDINGFNNLLPSTRNFITKLKLLLTSQQFWFGNQQSDIGSIFGTLDFKLSPLMGTMELFDQQQDGTWNILDGVVKFTTNNDTNDLNVNFFDQKTAISGQDNESNTSVNIGQIQNQQDNTQLKQQLISNITQTGQFTLEEREQLINQVNNQNVILDSFVQRINSMIQLVSGTLSTSDLLQLVVGEIQYLKVRYNSNVISYYKNGDVWQPITLNLDQGIQLLRSTTIDQIPHDALIYWRDGLSQFIDPMIFKGFNNQVTNLTGSGKLLGTNTDNSSGGGGFNLFALFGLLFQALINFPKTLISIIQVLSFVITNVIQQLQTNGLSGAFQALFKGVFYAFFTILFNFPLIDSLIIGIIFVLQIVLRLLLTIVHGFLILILVLLGGLYYVFGYVLPTKYIFDPINKYVMLTKVSCQEDINQWYMNDNYQLGNKTQKVGEMCYQPCIGSYKPMGKFFCQRDDSVIELPKYCNKALIMQTYTANPQYAQGPLLTFFKSGTVPQLDSFKLRNLSIQQDNVRQIQNYVENILDKYQQNIQSKCNLQIDQNQNIKLRDAIHEVQIQNICKVTSDPQIEKLCKKEYCNDQTYLEFCNRFVNVSEYNNNQQVSKLEVNYGRLQKISVCILLIYILFVVGTKFSK